MLLQNGQTKNLMLGCCLMYDADGATFDKWETIANNVEAVQIAEF